MKANREGTRPRRGLVFLAAAILAGGMVSLHAAVFTVSNTSDSGSGSLRQAILDANGTAGLNTVSCAGISGTITLASPLPELTGEMDIAGPSPDRLAVSGDRKFRVLQIAAGARVAISNLAVVDGYATNLGGAGVLSAGSLTLSGCRLWGNAMYGAPGGGVLSRGTLLLIESILSQNSVVGAYESNPDESRGRGGGLYVESGWVAISNCTLSANVARGGSYPFEYGLVHGGSGNGGGVFVQQGFLTMANTTVSGNSASGSVSYYPGSVVGGGWRIWVRRGPVLRE